MNDRTLLELAAKAAGIELGEWNDEAQWFWTRSWHWNPLTDDGDALRLAIKLNLLDVPDLEANTYGRIYGDNDPYAATRRAIVRAAAEIGKRIP